MKLYTSANSPFSARVQLAALAKGLSIPAEPLPAGGLKTDAFRVINPIAKIPVLITDEGERIPESTPILRYLEDRFPQPSLMPAGTVDRARVNVLIGIVDTYVMDPVIRLFAHLDPAARDARVVEFEVARWSAGAAWLAEAMAGGLPEAEAGLTLADCVLAPSMHLNIRIAAMLGLPEAPMRRHAPLINHEERMRRHALVGPVLEALTASQHAYDLKAGRPPVSDRHQPLSLGHHFKETTI